VKKSFVIHPFLISIFPILFLFSHNIEEVYYSEIMLPLALMISITILAGFVLRFIIHDYKKLGIILSVFFIIFFSYGHVHRLLPIKDRYLLLICGIVFICITYFTVKAKKELINITNTGNFIGILLVLISGINIGYYEIIKQNRTDDDQTNLIDSTNNSQLRDVYFIVLDGYANSTILKNIYKFNNDQFIDHLKKKGFYVASESQSNYVQTFLSLASTLNMEYVNYLKDMIGIDSKDRKVPYQMIKNSKVMKYLKSKGYKFIHFSSGWGATDGNFSADLDFRNEKLNEFQMILIRGTMLYPFLEQLHFFESKLRDRILNTFTKLAEIPKMKGAKFVFAHIMSPHPPYLFTSSGKTVKKINLNMSGSVWKEKDKYLNQLIFINQKIKILVEEILLKSKIPPVIILQADHGTASTFNDTCGWECPTEINFKERTGILNTIYLPKNNINNLYDSISPVNTFRLIFNFIFKTDYKLLNDRSYYSSENHPYKFIEITHKIR